jgi:hypothetical protein
MVRTLLAIPLLAMMASCEPMPPISRLGPPPDVDDFAARSRCVRQEIARMVADPAENTRGIADMATYAVGRCSQSVWSKIMHSTRDPRKIDDVLFDQVSAEQHAMGEVIEARERLRQGSP